MKPPSWLSLIAASLVLFSILGAASGATFVVNSTVDGAPGSLRDAITNANASGGGNIIFSGVSGNLVLTDELHVTANLTIQGPDAEILAVDGGMVGRVFRFTVGSTSSISGLTITKGRQGGSEGGGGILNSGHLTLSNCVVAGNFFIAPLGGGGIYNNGTLVLNRCAVTGNGCRDVFNNSSTAHGGGIYNAGTLRLNDSLVTSNFLERTGTLSPPSEPPNGLGAGIYNVGSALLTRSSLIGNWTAAGTDSDGRGGQGGSGAGFYNDSGAILNDCTVASNHCGDGGHAGGFGFDATGGKGGDGGGIYNAGTLSLTNTTLYGNSTGYGGQGGNTFSFPAGFGGDGGDGGNLYNSGAAYLTSVTVSSGSVGGGGLGGYTYSPFTMGEPGVPGLGAGIRNVGSVHIHNTIVASNSTDVSGSVISLGHNLIGTTNGCVGFGVTNDLWNVDARLGALASHGGLTPTCALVVGSAAIDAGDDLLAGLDQRGYPRPSGLHADIGAFEVQAPDSYPCLVTMGGDGCAFQFTGKPGAVFAVLASTNIALAYADWKAIGTAVEISPGGFQFTDTTTNGSRRFYRVRSP